MPGNPKKCREHARECQRLADLARSEQARQTFQNLADSWTRLANQLECTGALLEMWTDETTPAPDQVAGSRSR